MKKIKSFFSLFARFCGPFNTNLFFIMFITLLNASIVNAQMAKLHGTDAEYKRGLHDGNQFRISFWNDGTWGSGLFSSLSPGIFSGEWPINSDHLYLDDGDIFVISEVNDNYDPITKTFLTSPGTVRHIQSTVKSNNVQSSCGDRGPDQASGPYWWTFLPLPGFSNPGSDKIAMAKRGIQWENSWPSSWPDIADPSNPRYSADGWAGQWNGYFGRNKFNADEESYFVADDYAKNEFPGFRPDTNDVSRGGLGIRMSVRGFQWDQVDVENVLFCHLKFENIGSYKHNKVEFGFKLSCDVGSTTMGSDEGDDGGSYNIDRNLVWSYDALGTGNLNWGTKYGLHTGIIGVCFLESPGEPYDGIDNDNDGNPASPNYGMKNNEVGVVSLHTVNGPKTFYAGSGPVISTSMFIPRILGLNDKIVLIDYNDPHYSRTVKTFKQALLDQGKTKDTDTLVITCGGVDHRFLAGDTLKEIGDNIFDDNLNGIIDENRGVIDPSTGIISYLYVGHKYIDYLNPDVTTNGSLNPLIDERRDDGIDNNDNWDPSTDDVGADGLGPKDDNYPGPDIGEGDGRPTLGEPHFDETDVNESDMIGLTSYDLYPWSNEFCQFDDEKMWEIYRPGTFITSPVGFVEVAAGSGYFPLFPKTTQMISLGIMCASAEPTGMDTTALMATISKVAFVFKNNYKLPTVPVVPTLQVKMAGNKITLTWDSLAENSFDPVLGSDFEGYRIYKSMNPNSFDSTCIVAQFDLDDKYFGYSAVPHHGHYFWLGKNTGLQHSWTDSNVIYGMDYYYALTSYDHGSGELNIPPSECSAGIFINSSGDAITEKNAVKVMPVDTGALKYPTKISLVNGFTNGSINCEIVDTWPVKRNHTYHIIFQDTLSGIQVKNFTLIDVTIGDTVLREVPFFGIHRSSQLVDGFRLTLENVGNGEQTLIEDSSGWNRPGILHPKFQIFNYSGMTSKAMTGDFKVIIGNLGMDTSTYFLRGNTPLPSIPVNFTVINTLTNKKVDFAFRELDKTNGTGNFTINRSGSLSDQIIFLTPKSIGSDTLIAGWQLQLMKKALGDTALPENGDTLILKLTKPFLADNIFEFTMPDIPVGVFDQEKNPLPKCFSLSQNYPNPFNPTTIVRFSLPIKSNVHLYLLNILGQLVKDIIHGNYDAGYHEVTINASTLASGVYFYRLVTNTGFVQTKKLLLLK